MLRFECDYGEGAAPAGAGASAARPISTRPPAMARMNTAPRLLHRSRGLCDAPDADVHFFVGATQANLTVIAAALKPWQGVLLRGLRAHPCARDRLQSRPPATSAWHLPGKNGKITARQVRKAVEEHRANASHEHEVQPGMVVHLEPHRGRHPL